MGDDAAVDTADVLGPPGPFPGHQIACLGLVELATEMPAPGLGRLKDALKNVMLFAQRTMAEKGETPRYDDDRDHHDEESDGHGFALDEDMEDDMVSGDGPITSRAQAYKMLDAAADYLLRAEPHSPAPYLVKRAVTWGRMPLQDLLKEAMGILQ